MNLRLPAVLATAILTLGLAAFNSAKGPEPRHPATVAMPSGLKLLKITGGLQSPTGMADPNDGSARLFILEQQGLVRILDHGKLLAQPFLDLRPKMVKPANNYDERGLLGIALHPDFKKNHKFYVFYSAVSADAGSNCRSVIAEYQVSTVDPNKALEGSGRVLLTFDKPEMNHDGGQLAFGPDGYLYIGVGDGGGAGDEHGTYGNGQKMDTYLAKILRIDVNHKNGKGYSVPSDNPFLKVKGDKPEIYAYGLRNPWRFSFDSKTGRLFCGDVGQDLYEEVDIIKKGGNYGWRKMEASHCFNPATNCREAGMILPIDEYKHPMGISITGGFIYRGKSIPALDGRYLFADWSGPLFCLTEENGGADKWTRTLLPVVSKPAQLRIESLGQDHEGEVYYLTSTGASPYDNSGAVYKLVP